MLRKAQREMQARRRRGKAICRAERGGKVSNNYCPFRRGKPRHLPRGGRLGTRDVADAVPYRSRGLLLSNKRRCVHPRGVPLRP